MYRGQMRRVSIVRGSRLGRERDRAALWSLYIFHAGAAAAEPASAGLPEGLTRPAVYGWGTENKQFLEPACSGLLVGFSQHHYMNHLIWAWMAPSGRAASMWGGKREQEGSAFGDGPYSEPDNIIAAAHCCDARRWLNRTGTAEAFV